MQSAVALNRLEVVARSAERRGSRTRALIQALRRLVRLDVFWFEDGMGRAIDRAFAELAREMLE